MTESTHYCDDISHDRYRERFKAGKDKMRHAFDGLRRKPAEGDQANDLFFDGNEEVNAVWGEVLLRWEIAEAELEQLRNVRAGAP